MPDKIKRINCAITLAKSEDISNKQCFEIIDSITREKTSNSSFVIKGSRRNTKWTHEENNALRKMIGEGKSYKTIAKKLKRSYHSVRVRSYRELKKNYSRATSIKNLQNNRWKPIDEKILMDMLTEGKSFDDIGNVLKRSRKAVELRYFKIRSRGKK
jgi:DNA-binding NarL/FixJ family response regulator